MRQLLPEPQDMADLAVLDDRTDRVAPEGRPWVMANMVMSIDGAHALDGRSGGLGSPGDRTLFHRLRGSADAILATGSTVRAERYRRPRTDEPTLARRRANGLADHPRLVIVSASMHLPPDLPLLRGPGEEPLVLHPRSADASGVPAGVELRQEGASQVELPEALGRLRNDGVELLLCEGGPTLLGQLHRADLIDELFVTLSPILVGGPSVGMLGPGESPARRIALHRLWEEEGSLFATYRRIPI